MRPESHSIFFFLNSRKAELKKKKKTDDKGMIKEQQKCPWMRKEDMNGMFLNS